MILSIKYYWKISLIIINNKYIINEKIKNIKY